MKIQLIRPPLDWWYGSPQITQLISLPIGLLILAKVIKARFEKIEVEVFDGLFLKIDDVLKKIDGDIVGVYNIYPNHLNCLKILEVAKNKGRRTVIGGPNVNYLAERILQNHSFVDFAVCGDGEEAIIDLIEGKNQSLIPNLAFRQDIKIIRNPEKSVFLDTLFNLESITKYHDQYLDRFNPKMPVPLSSIRGCMKAKNSKKCIYCSMNHHLLVMEPELVWEQIGLLNDYGLSYFFETGDCFKVGDFPEKLLASRPKYLRDTSFRVYVSPEDAKDAKFVETLRKLNVTEVFLGVESVNNKILINAGKKCTKEDIRRAIEILGNFSHLHIPFMYGLHGETLQTAEENFSFAKSLVETYGPSKIRITSHFAIPLPGSRLFEIVKNDNRIKTEYSGNLDKDDLFDWRELIQLFVKYYCLVDFDTLEKYVVKTLSLIPGQSTSFGINSVPIL